MMPITIRRIVFSLTTLLVFSLFMLHPSAQAEVTANVLTRIFQIRFGSNLGTCFTFDVGGRQYLITARHVVAGIKSEDKIEIMRDGQWQFLAVKAFFPSPDFVDIVVLAPPFQISSTLPLPPAESYMLSQDVYFLGFPYGLYVDDKILNGGYPLPFVKKGVLAAFPNDEGGTPVLIIDGMNNPGFSGGPVVLKDSKSGNWSVASVISSYHVQDDRVLLDGKGTPLSVRSNSGLIYSYGIMKALEVIKANPVGAIISKAER